MQLRDQYVTVNNISLRCSVAGNPARPAIVFLHGFPEWGGAWEEQLRFFAARGYYAVAPDQRGYGWSDKPRGVRSYTLDQLADDVAALVAALGPGPVVLVGHDWGGAVAWAFAHRHPALLRRLVVLNMPHPSVMTQTLKRDPGQLLRSWYAGFFQLPWLPERLCAAFGYAVLKRTLRRTSRPGTFGDAGLARYREAWAQPGALHAMINWYRAFRYNRGAGFGTDVPTLLLWGRKDAFLKASMAPKSIARCSKGRLRWLDDATHWLHHEVPEAVNAAILEFLEESG
ncbi:MAG: alpha/beta hydrolase [Chitinophagaceae bacterium]|nr:MAG: alpha/beta hydrolase [Chitinophagaceae bacterium]